MMHEDVLELIQRDLDGDLTSNEKSTLQSLVQNDPNVQLMYSRLQRVSSDLASLPPVVPPFSIVDSILPELDEVSSNTIAAIVTKPHIPKLQRKQQYTETPRRSIMPVWLAKVGSGVAAACLLFGLFVMANGHREDRNSGHGQETVVNQPMNQQSIQPVDQTPQPVVKPNPKQEPTVKKVELQQATTPAKETPMATEQLQSVTRSEASNKKADGNRATTVRTDVDVTQNPKPDTRAAVSPANKGGIKGTTAVPIKKPSIKATVAPAQASKHGKSEQQSPEKKNQGNGQDMNKDKNKDDKKKKDHDSDVPKIDDENQQQRSIEIQIKFPFLTQHKD